MPPFGRAHHDRRQCACASRRHTGLAPLHACQALPCLELASQKILFLYACTVTDSNSLQNPVLPNYILQKFSPFRQTASSKTATPHTPLNCGSKKLPRTRPGSAWSNLCSLKRKVVEDRRDTSHIVWATLPAVRRLQLLGPMRRSKVAGGVASACSAHSRCRFIRADALATVSQRTASSAGLARQARQAPARCGEGREKKINDAVFAYRTAKSHLTDSECQRLVRCLEHCTSCISRCSTAGEWSG
jgi:hypothetical protein